MLLNLSNHPNSQWSIEQLTASVPFGEIVDFPFPQVDPYADEEEISELAKLVADQVLAMRPNAVLCQGEMTLCFAIVSLLKRHDVKVLAACSERKAVEVKTDTGSIKTSIFVFCRYREYSGCSDCWDLSA